MCFQFTHETMVCAVCLSIFFCIWTSSTSSHWECCSDIKRCLGNPRIIWVSCPFYLIILCPENTALILKQVLRFGKPGTKLRSKYIRRRITITIYFRTCSYITICCQMLHPYCGAWRFLWYSWSWYHGIPWSNLFRRLDVRRLYDAIQNKTHSIMRLFYLDQLSCTSRQVVSGPC